MLKNILLLSLSGLFFITSVNAATTCGPGEYLVGSECVYCSKGYYKEGTNSATSCNLCGNYNNILNEDGTRINEFIDYVSSGIYGGNTNAETACKWKIQCDIGNPYWNGETCTTCDTHYTDTRVYYMELPYTTSPTSIRSCTNCCEPNIYTITLTAIDPDDPNNKDTRMLYVKYKVGFSTEKNPTGWPTGIDHDILPTFPAESSWWLNETSIFSGYYNEETMIIDGSGGTKAGNDQIKSDIEAKAKFNNAVQYTVNYKYNDEPDGTETQSCYYVREGRKCTAKNFNNSKYSLGNKVFAAWCLEKSGNTCTKRIEVGGDIPRPKKPSVIGNLDKQSVTLTPILEDCPAGYYCQAGNKTACPGGTTSDSGASSINDCYLKGGVTQMCGVFNGKTQCATLDSGTDRIYY